MVTWTWKHGDMTWGHGHGDMEALSWRHEHGGMDMKRLVSLLYKEDV